MGGSDGGGGGVALALCGSGVGGSDGDMITVMMAERELAGIRGRWGGAGGWGGG